MRICHVKRGNSAVPTWGGAETAVADLVRATAGRGHDMFVVAPLSFIDAADIRGAANTFASDVTRDDVVRLAKVFRRWRIDVVVTHTLRSAVVGGWAARLAGVPARVSNLHNSLYQEAVHVNRLGTAKGNLLFAARNTAFRTTVRGRGERTVAISPSVAAELVSFSRVPADRIVTIPNWVSPRFRLSAGDITGPRTGLLFAGRFEAQKNPRVVIDVAKLLGPEVSVDMYGDGPMLSTVKADAAVRAPWVAFHEPTDAPEQLFRRSAAVIVPSLFEGFGRVAVEALSCGAQVVLADVAGLHDAVDELAPELTRFVRGYRIEDWAAACAAALTAEVEGRQRIAAARAAADARSLDGAVDTYLATYETCLSESTRWPRAT